MLYWFPLVMPYWFPLNHQSPKHQVVHEQKFKDLLSSKCQVSVERIVLDLESEGLGSITTRDNILFPSQIYTILPDLTV